MIHWFLALLLCIASLAFGMIIAAKTIRTREEEVLHGALDMTARAIAIGRQHAVMHATLAGIIKAHGTQSCPVSEVDSDSVPSIRYEQVGENITLFIA